MRSSSLDAHGDLAPEDDIDLLDALLVLAKHKLLIISFTLVGALGATVCAWLLPNIYTATAKLLPPTQNQSSAALLVGQLGNLTNLVPGSNIGLKNPGDLYVGMLTSRSVADNIIAQFNLQSLYAAKTMVLTRSILSGNTNVVAGKDGLIAIEFEDEDPVRAAKIANAYVDELQRLTQTLAVTEASQRRLFYEQQLVQAKNNLVAAEIAARAALQEGGVAMVDEQGKSMIESIAALRARITATEVQIAAMGFATEQNPDYIKARQELVALRQQLAKLEGTGKGLTDLAAVGESSGQGLKNLALLRDVKFNEILFELLVKQYELAKMDEAKDAGIVQVVDRAIPTDQKSKPSRFLIIMIVTLAAAFAASVLAFMIEARARMGQDPSRAERLASLRHYLTSR